MAYRLGVFLRNSAYDEGIARSVRLPCRVISVGNLALGGTGKTPFVEVIARKLRVLDQRVAILSRGYGAGHNRDYWLRNDKGKLLVNGEPLSMAPMGLADEPQLLAQHLEGVPVFVGPKRARLGQQALRECRATTLILDDGFQHRSLKRDCDIVLLHGRMPFSGWPLLPRGPMREPLNNLRRAEIVVITRIDEALEHISEMLDHWRPLAPDAIFVTAFHKPTGLYEPMTDRSYSIQQLDGLRVGLLSSIGDPQGFELTVRDQKANVLWHRAFPDHHPYQETDWQAIVQESKRQYLDAVLTTEKDWVRLKRVATSSLPHSLPLWILTIRMKLLSGEDELNDRLISLCAR